MSTNHPLALHPVTTRLRRDDLLIIDEIINKISRVLSARGITLKINNLCKADDLQTVITYCLEVSNASGGNPKVMLLLASGITHGFNKGVLSKLLEGLGKNTLLIFVIRGQQLDIDMEFFAGLTDAPQIEVVFLHEGRAVTLAGHYAEQFMRNQ